MKQFRFSLCPNLDARLIDKIEQKANGGSENEALRQMIRFWEEQEERQNMTSGCQNNAIEHTDNDNLADTNEINLSSLDATFSELEE